MVFLVRIVHGDCVLGTGHNECFLVVQRAKEREIDSASERFGRLSPVLKRGARDSRYTEGIRYLPANAAEKRHEFREKIAD